MASRLAIVLHGATASLDPRKGEPSAIVALACERGDVLLDLERNRARLARIPGTDLDKWVSGSGILLLARLGWWGCSMIDDLLPRPEVGRDPGASRADRKRPFLPRDLASCPACHRLVILARDRKGRGFGLVTPSRRLASQARQAMRAAGLMPFLVSEQLGRGRKANRPHDLDCCTLPLFRFNPLPAAGRRKPARPRARKAARC